MSFAFAFALALALALALASAQDSLAGCSQAKAKLVNTFIIVKSC